MSCHGDLCRCIACKHMRVMLLAAMQSARRLSAASQSGEQPADRPPYNLTGGGGHGSRYTPAQHYRFSQQYVGQAAQRTLLLQQCQCGSGCGGGMRKQCARGLCHVNVAIAKACNQASRATGAPTTYGVFTGCVDHTPHAAHSSCRSHLTKVYAALCPQSSSNIKHQAQWQWQWQWQ